jgi:hypothetical protein
VAGEGGSPQAGASRIGALEPSQDIEEVEAMGRAFQCAQQLPGTRGIRCQRACYTN